MATEHVLLLKMRKQNESEIDVESLEGPLEPMGETRWQPQESAMRRNEKADYEREPRKLFRFISPG